MTPEELAAFIQETAKLASGYQRAARYWSTPEPERGHVPLPAPHVALRSHHRGREPLPKEARKPHDPRHTSYLTEPEYLTVSARQINALTEEGARNYILDVLHGQEGRAFDGRHPCPKCGSIEAHTFYERLKRYVCQAKGCRHQFSLFSGTPLHGTTLDARTFLTLMREFVEAKDARSAREFGGIHAMDDQTVRVLFLKVRERIAITMLAEPKLDGVIQIDAAYFMKHKRAPNMGTAVALSAKAKRKNAGLDENAKVKSSVSPKMWAVVVFAQEGPQKRRAFRVAVVKTENSVEVLDLAQQFCEPSAIAITDGGSGFKVFTGEFEAKYDVPHAHMFADELGNSVNMAELFHSRVRAAEKGAFHKFTVQYLELYAWEFAWRQQMVGHDNLYQLNDLIRRVLVRERSLRFRNYWKDRPWDGDEDGERYFLTRVPAHMLPGPKRGRPPAGLVRPKPPEREKRHYTKRKPKTVTPPPEGETGSQSGEDG